MVTTSSRTSTCGLRKSTSLRETTQPCSSFTKPCVPCIKLSRNIFRGRRTNCDPFTHCHIELKDLVEVRFKSIAEPAEFFQGKIWQSPLLFLRIGYQGADGFMRLPERHSLNH